MPRNQSGCSDPPMYRFLLEFSKGTKACRTCLINRYGEEKLNEALEKGYIVEIGKTDIGAPQYVITEKGREVYN